MTVQTVHASRPEHGSADDAQALATRLLHAFGWVMRSHARFLRGVYSSVEPTHFRVLWRLSHQPCRVSQLATTERVSLPSMSKTIAVLVKWGWVERSADAGDRRVTILNLTADGQGALHEMHRVTVEHLAGALNQLSASERAGLSIGLAALLVQVGRAASNPIDQTM